MKYKILQSFSICIFIVATILTAKTANAAAPLTIKIDGNLRDAAWKKGRAISAFQTLNGETPKAQTTGTILTDADYLYLAFRCDEPEMNKLQQTQKPRDGALWNNDCVEIFIAPFENQKTFYHFIVDINGQIYDALNSNGNEDNRYDLGIIAATQKQVNSWTMEMAIPLCDLGLSNSHQPLMNFCRERKPVGELTSWHGLFAKPDTWQPVKLSLNKKRSVDMRDWDFGKGSPLYGFNIAKSTFAPNTKAALKVLLYVEGPRGWNLTNNYLVITTSQDPAAVSVPYLLLPRDEPQRIRLVVANNNEAVFRATYQLNLPEKALVARLQTPYYYSNEHYGFVQIENVISTFSMPTASIRLLVKSPDGKLQQTKNIQSLQPSMTIGFDISKWKKGDGAIFIEQLNNGIPVAHQRLVVSKRLGPFAKSTF
jgi:hypothetical protein